MDATVTRIMIYCIMIYTSTFSMDPMLKPSKARSFWHTAHEKVRACSSTTNHIRPKKCPGKVVMVPGHLAGFNMSATLPSAAVVQKGKPCERRILWYLPWPLKSGWVVLGSSFQLGLEEHAKPVWNRQSTRKVSWKHGNLGSSIEPLNVSGRPMQGTISVWSKYVLSNVSIIAGYVLDHNSKTSA